MEHLCRLIRCYLIAERIQVSKSNCNQDKSSEPCPLYPELGKSANCCEYVNNKDTGVSSYRETLGPIPVATLQERFSLNDNQFKIKRRIVDEENPHVTTYHSHHGECLWA